MQVWKSPLTAGVAIKGGFALVQDYNSTSQEKSQLQNGYKRLQFGYNLSGKKCSTSKNVPRGTLLHLVSKRINHCHSLIAMQEQTLYLFQVIPTSLVLMDGVSLACAVRGYVIAQS